MSTDFPTRLRSERARLGLTQSEAAELLGVGRGSYRQLEEDRIDPRLSTVVRLIKAGYRLKAIAPELVE